MKNLILAISIFSFSSFAMAEQTVTLNFNNVTLASQENAAAQLDISRELQKQSPGISTAGQRLKSIKVSGSASALGATLLLLVSGRAIDSQTVQTSNANVTLSSNVGITPGQWTLAVRGQISVQQIVVTLDAQGTTSDEYNFNREEKVLKAIPVELPGEFTKGQKLLYVDPNSKTSQVYVHQFYQDGTVGIAFQGKEYYIKDMKQLAIVSGCSENGEFCVGDPVVATARDGRVFNARIVGIQTNDLVVLSFNGQAPVGNWPTHAIQY